MSGIREQALVVDGDAEARAAAVAALAAAGYECHEREDPTSALEFLRGMEEGLVVTDLDLPGGDGSDLLRIGRQRYPRLGMIVLSSRCDAEAAVVAFQNGALDYLVKPVADSELVRRMSRASEKQQLLLQHEEYQRSLEEKVVQRTRELQETRDQILQTLGEAVAARHTETHTHTQRVTQLSLQLARALGLSGRALTGIEWGAALHDVGKIGIPDSILLKPSSLTDEEWEMMKRHCEIGHRMLRGFSFLGNALDVVLHHHERFDGRGYPFGLQGETIPFAARIFAVVDAYDAMTNDRPYRPPLDPEDAREELARCSSAQFDPMIVDAFLGMSESSVRGEMAYAGAS
jgi:response regulator RpfG family c-di-GMP phosphodiesterase